MCFFFFSSRRRHTRFDCDWSSDVCSSDLASEAFGVDRVQLTYHVVLEKKGFLGGIKRIVVEAEVNDRPIAAAVQEASAPAPRAGRPAGGGRGRGNRDRDRG